MERIVFVGGILLNRVIYFINHLTNKHNTTLHKTRYLIKYNKCMGLCIKAIYEEDNINNLHKKLNSLSKDIKIISKAKVKYVL